MKIEKGDIVNFEGDFYEVENVNGDSVELSSSERGDFSLDTEYLKLVCKKENRLDVEGKAFK